MNSARTLRVLSGLARTLRVSKMPVTNARASDKSVMVNCSCSWLSPGTTWTCPGRGVWLSRRWRGCQLPLLPKMPEWATLSASCRQSTYENYCGSFVSNRLHSLTDPTASLGCAGTSVNLQTSHGYFGVCLLPTVYTQEFLMFASLNLPLKVLFWVNLIFWVFFA